MATEAIKLILGKGEALIGRMLVFDSLAMKFHEFKLKRDEKCAICGDYPTINQLLDDYVAYAESSS